MRALRSRRRAGPSARPLAPCAAAAARARRAACPPRSGAPGEQRGRFAMCLDGRRMFGREGREIEHGLCVSGCVRMMRQPREVAIAAPALEQRRERDTMKAARAGGRDRLLEGQSGELVPERDVQSADTSTPEATQSSSLASIAPESASISQGSARGGAIATASSRSRAPGERRPARARTASRTVGGIVPPEASTSVTKNALPAVVRWSSCGSIPRGSASRELRRGRGARGALGEGGRLTRATEHEPQRVTRVQSSSRSSGRSRRGSCRCGGREANHVESRLVRPVDVLNHDNRRPAPAQLVDERRGHGVWHRVAAKEIPQGVARFRRDVWRGPSGCGVRSASQIPRGRARPGAGGRRTPAGAPSCRHLPRR